MPEDFDFDAPAEVPETPKEDVPAEAPVGAAVVEYDGEPTKEQIAAAANSPGENVVVETEDEGVEVAEAEVSVVIDPEAPVSEVYVEVPGLSPEDAYVEVETVESDGELEARVPRIYVGSKPVKLPAQVAELVAATPFVVVAE